MTDQNNSTNDVDDIDVTDASDVAGVAEVDATGETANVTKQDVPYRSGFVAVVGRPNVGKSTLINALIGKQIAIASSRPETTRKAIRGILTADHAQLVLVDTPGIHRPRTLLGQRLNDVVDESLADVDVVAFLLPADQESGEQFNPQFRTPQGCDGRHQYAVEHIAGDAEERTAAGGGVTVGDEPLHAMNLVDLLHLEELACFGVGLHLEDEIVKAGSRYAGHGAFSGGHGQREPDEQGRHEYKNDGDGDRRGTGILHNDFSVSLNVLERYRIIRIWCD